MKGSTTVDEVRRVPVKGRPKPVVKRPSAAAKAAARRMMKPVVVEKG